MKIGIIIMIIINRKMMVMLLGYCSSFHSGHFYSTPSSPLPVRGALDYSTDTVSEFHAKAHRQLQVKVPTWPLERELNPRPSGWKSSSQPRRHHVQIRMAEIKSFFHEICSFLYVKNEDTTKPSSWIMRSPLSYPNKLRLFLHACFKHPI